MRCVERTYWLCCALLMACSVDRLPLTEESLVSDAADAGAGALDADVDAMASEDAGHDAASDAAWVDAVAELDAAEVDAAVDADTTDASEDASVDAPVVLPPQRYQGACASDQDCELDEVCVRSEGLFVSHSYCSQRCTEDLDCDKGPRGSGASRCTSNGRCRLPCDAVIGEGCPATMVCQDLLLILPANDGTCTFEE